MESLIPLDAIYMGTETWSEMAFIGLPAVRELVRGYAGSESHSEETYFVGDGFAHNPIWQNPTVHP